VTRVDYYIFFSELAPSPLQQQHQCGTAGAEKANVLFILVRAAAVGDSGCNFEATHYADMHEEERERSARR
jgi:hypothetical protein